MSDPFAPIDAWFASKGWEPFPFQREVWSAYLAGCSGLIHAATGTGKTYAALFGPILESIADCRLQIADWKTKAKASASENLQSAICNLQLLWLTPLRALASDTVQALEAPLGPLGVGWKVESRTADTSSSARARQRKRLPEVLVTTPESLSLFLTWPNAPELFAGLRCVVVDEWHELLASKRGVQTELALARLRRWRPGLRTWGLSATLGNLDEALAALVGVGPGAAERTRAVRGLMPKQVRIDSVVPARVERFPWAGHLGLSLLPQVVAAVEEGRTALVFTNTRSQTESWYQAILQARPDWAGLVALHHGSLDRSVRDWVEEGLREGRLRCVVCTSSLDLGVDFSPVDRVIQIGSPKGVARLLQRAGRSGHQPGAVSRVTCVPTNALELVEVAAARAAAEGGAVEGRAPIEKPLDVLAQHAVTVALGGGFQRDELLAEVRTAYAYRHLSDVEWDWVLDFVTRGGETLKAYPDYHRVALEDGVYRVTRVPIARRHRMSLGTIVSDAAVQVRFLRGPRLGTVEETFVARLRPGDRFVFAGRTLEFVRFHEMTAWVRKAARKANVVPRWYGGKMPLSSELAGAVRAVLERARGGDFSGPELSAVRPILELQAAWSRIPARDELLVERLRSREGHHLFFYPFEGRHVHEGLAALLAYRLSRLVPVSFTLAVNDYGFELLSPEPAPIEEGLRQGLFGVGSLADDILASLNAAELARRQFREIARVAGLVFPGFPGAGKSARQLQASSGLLYNVFREYDPENLLLHQARREVLERQLEFNRLRQTLDRLAASRLALVDVPKPTPLGFPLLVDRMRETVSSEKLADRVRRMTLELERSAG